MKPCKCTICNLGTGLDDAAAAAICCTPISNVIGHRAWLAAQAAKVQAAAPVATATTQAAPVATFRKTAVGWRLFSTERLAVGQVSARKADGSVKTVTIIAAGGGMVAQPTEGGFIYCFTDPTAAPAAKPGKLPMVRGCNACRALGYRCRQCTHDTF